MAVDLADLETRLNSDPAFRQQFLDDPVATLAAQGLTLSPDMQANLKSLVEELKNPPKQVAGSSVAHKGQATDVDVKITIGKSF